MLIQTVATVNRCAVGEFVVVDLVGSGFCFDNFPLDGNMLIENRPLFNLNWSGRINDVRLSNRSRIEFREYTWNKKDDIRFRNRTRIELPWAVLPFEIKPYFEEEFFYGKESARIEKNWLTGGLYYKVTKQVKLKLGYRWIAVRSAHEWENLNQIVTGLNLVF